MDEMCDSFNQSNMYLTRVPKGGTENTFEELII